MRSGFEPLVLEAMHFAAAGETHLHFVEHDLNAVGAATILDGLEKAGRRHDEAAVRHQGLDEDGGDLGGRTAGRELIVEKGQHLVRAESPAIRVGIREKQQSGARQGVRHGGVTADAHRSREISVIGADEGNEAAPSGRGLQHAHGAIVGIRTGVAEPDAPVGLPGRQLQQIFGEAHRLAVRERE